jgi:hypothetical protein
MDHVQEHTLDLYIMNPELLDAGQRAALQEHLDQCEGCRRLADTMKAFYQELEQHLVQPVADAGILMRRIFPAPRFLEFPPPAASTSIDRPAPNAGQTAAQDRPSALLLERRSTGNDATLRLFHEVHTERYRLALCPRTFELEECGVASIPNVEGGIVLDDTGQGVFPVPAPGCLEGWESGKIVIRFPVAQLHISTLRAREEGLRTFADPAGRVSASMTLDPGRLVLTVSLSPPDREVKFVLINGPAAGHTLLPVVGGVCTLPAEAGAEELLIDIYA